MSSTHIYYNASFLKKDKTQQNIIFPTECNLSIPSITTQPKKNHFSNPNATQMHLAPPPLN